MGTQKKKFDNRKTKITINTKPVHEFIFGTKMNN